jgi:hypothetical protein
MEHEHELVNMWVLQFETFYGEPTINKRRSKVCNIRIDKPRDDDERPNLLLSSALEEKNIQNYNKPRGEAIEAKQPRTTTSRSPNLLSSSKTEEKNAKYNCN